MGVGSFRTRFETCPLDSRSGARNPINTGFSALRALRSVFQGTFSAHSLSHTFFVLLAYSMEAGCLPAIFFRERSVVNE
jgi:hypothetical protein